MNTNPCLIQTHTPTHTFISYLSSIHYLFTYYLLIIYLFIYPLLSIIYLSSTYLSIHLKFDKYLQFQPTITAFIAAFLIPIFALSFLFNQKTPPTILNKFT